MTDIVVTLLGVTGLIILRDTVVMILRRRNDRPKTECNPDESKTKLGDMAVGYWRDWMGSEFRGIRDAIKELSKAIDRLSDKP